MRKALWGLLWAARCAVAAAVPAALALVFSWLLLELWRGGHRTTVPVLLQLGGFPFYFGAIVLTARYARRQWRNRSGRWKAVLCWAGTVTAIGGWFATVLSGTSAIDQRALHDRGVTATGVITRTWFDQGDGASRTSYCNVRLGNGTTLTVEGEGQTGRSAQVTYDPRGKTDPQFGHRPPAPDPLPLETSRALLVLGFALTAGAVSGPLKDTTAGTVPPWDAAPAS
ncbi:hypothetical protein [Streptomyces sp. AM6-12]|uniref:hypothetical protein n=1 Tax=Streptomyces sp. AM6-12 TaxID=3345149 RepID=UPI00379DCD72